MITHTTHGTHTHQKEHPLPESLFLVPLCVGRGERGRENEAHSHLTQQIMYKVLCYVPRTSYLVPRTSYLVRGTKYIVQVLCTSKL